MMFYKKVQISLTKKDSDALKGIAILLIIFHNFFHLIIPGVPGENEFYFNSEKSYFFIRELFDNPFDFIRLIFSFFGHYGVQVFLFLSAYGLAVSKPKTSPFWSGFMLKRFIKIYPAFLLSIIFFIIYYSVMGEDLIHLIMNNWQKIILRLSLLSNLYPHHALDLVGPWWFVSLIFQFYFIYIPLQKMYRRYGAISLIIISCVCLIIEYTLNNNLISYGVNINHTIIGHISTICLGLYFGSSKNIYLPNYSFILAIIIFFLGMFYEPVWLLSGLFFTVTIIYLYCSYTKLGTTNVSIRALEYLGGLSLYLFLLNGITRGPFIDTARNHIDIIAWALLMSLPSLLFCIACSILVRHIENNIMKMIKTT